MEDKCDVMGEERGVKHNVKNDVIFCKNSLYKPLYTLHIKRSYMLRVLRTNNQQPRSRVGMQFSAVISVLDNRNHK